MSASLFVRDTHTPVQFATAKAASETLVELIYLDHNSLEFSSPLGHDDKVGKFARRSA